MTCCSRTTTCTSSDQPCCVSDDTNTQGHCCSSDSSWNASQKKCTKDPTLPINYLPMALLGMILPLVGWGIWGSSGILVGCLLNMGLNLLFFWTVIGEANAQSASDTYEIGELFAASLIMSIFYSIMGVLVSIAIIVTVMVMHRPHKLGSIVSIIGMTGLTTLGGISLSSIVFSWNTEKVCENFYKYKNMNKIWIYTT